MTATIARQVQSRLHAQLAAATSVVAGADLGNSTSLYSANGTTVQIPSFVGVGNLDDLISARQGGGGTGALRPGEIAIEHGGICSFVGALAVDQVSDATTQRGNANRYTNGHTLLLLMALVAEAHPTLTSIKLRLVTGLPIALFKERPALKTDVRRSLEGVHFCTVYDCHGTRQMSLEIEAVGVVMEGLAAVRAFAAPGKPIVVIDIGGGSYDVAYINAAAEPVETRSGSLLNNGSERIGELLSGWFRREYGRSLTPSEIEAALQNYLIGQPTTIYEAGERMLDVATIQRAIATVTGQGDSFLAQKLGPRPGSDAALAMVIGGAARYIRPGLHCPIEVPNAPERTNVEAYAVFAQRAEATGAWPKKA